MKNRMMMIGVVVGVIALTAAFEFSSAQAPAGPSPASKIGVVSISGVFNKCQRQIQYRDQVLATQSRTRAELDALAKQIDAQKAELDTLKPSSDDYLKLMQSLIENQAKLNSRQEYLKQQRAVEDRRWFEKLYQELLKTVTAIAQEKKLDVVLERTEPSFPLPQASDELMAMVSTHKVLYAAGCVDLTDEVIARLDASVKPQN